MIPRCTEKPKSWDTAISNVARTPMTSHALVLNNSLSIDARPAVRDILRGSLATPLAEGRYVNLLTLAIGLTGKRAYREQSDLSPLVGAVMEASAITGTRLRWTGPADAGR